MLIPNEAEKWSTLGIVPSLSVEWGAPAIICDNANEVVLGELNRRLKEAWCHSKQMEPFTLWSNATNRGIKELKKGSNRKLIKSVTPKRFWDDGLELESYIRSITTYDIYKLDGEVPKTVMDKEMSNKSQFCEFEGFEWVMF